jgi:hypothetical protein
VSLSIYRHRPHSSCIEGTTVQKHRCLILCTPAHYQLLLLTCRQRNARLELSNVNDNPESLLAALHAERETAEEEIRRRAEQEEDDAEVAKHFAKIPSGPPVGASAKLKSKEKGKGKQIVPDGDSHTDAGVIAGDAEAGDEGSDGVSSDGDIDLPLPTALTVKRAPGSALPAASKAGAAAEPSVASILAAKGRALDGASAAAISTSGIGTTNGSAASAQAQVKRKREGMQKLLGIKKKKA